MTPKSFTRIFILVLILLSTFAVPAGVQAGGAVCGSSYIVQWGDTLEAIAARCGTTVSAIFAANPGISNYLYAGQVLVIPTGSPCNCTGSGYIYAYTVQPGDTFSAIAGRYGVTVNDLWAANPQIVNINQLYPGQVIYVPSPVWAVIVTPPAASEPLVPLSYGSAPAGAPKGTVELSNKAKAQVYVSLQGTRADGTQVINEYPVGGTMSVTIPAGWYVYVAWVGGQKFVGQFQLNGGSKHSITFYSSKVVVE